jgi:hypothetical protein
VRNYTVQVDFEGGSYVLGLRELRPGETFALDLRELRDGGEPDRHGTVMPSDAASGQMHWSSIGAENHTMVGRAEYVDRVHGLASTFACSSCCPDSFAAAWASPGTMLLPVTAYGILTAFQENTNCYGQLLNPFQFYRRWGSSNSSVLGVSSGGVATGFSPGTAQGQAPRVVCKNYYRLLPSPGCESSCFTIVVASQATVAPNISGITPNKGAVNGSVSVTISGIGFGTNPAFKLQEVGSLCRLTLRRRLASPPRFRSLRMPQRATTLSLSQPTALRAIASTFSSRFPRR